MQGGSHLWRASLMFLCLPSLDTRICSFEIVPDDVLLILFHVSLSLKTEELVKAAQTWRTPLKLWRQRQMSATAAHFSEGKDH